MDLGLSVIGTTLLLGGGLALVAKAHRGWGATVAFWSAYVLVAAAGASINLVLLRR